MRLCESLGIMERGKTQSEAVRGRTRGVARKGLADDLASYAGKQKQ